MGNMKIVGLPRYSLSGLASGSTVPATMPPTNLTNSEPWDVARLTEVDPLKTYVAGPLTMPLGNYGPEPSVEGVAWVNHSLSLGAIARTLLLNTAVGADSYTPEGVLPNADYDHVGTWSVTFADVDYEPFNPGGSMQTSSGDGGGSWGIRREPTRSVKINLSNLTASEAQSLLERLWRVGGIPPWVVQGIGCRIARRMRGSGKRRVRSTADSFGMGWFRAETPGTGKRSAPATGPPRWWGCQVNRTAGRSEGMRAINSTSATG